MSSRAQSLEHSIMHHALSGARVLLVDEDHLARRVLERSLKAAGVIVSAARKAEDARGLIQHKELDAAVVGLRLTGGSGASIVAALSAREPPVGCVITTVSSGLEAARECIACGAQELLVKPFESEKFLEVVARTVERSRARRLGLGAEQSAAVEGSSSDSPFGKTNGNKRKLIAYPGRPAANLLDLENAADALVRMGDLSSRERVVLVPLLAGRQNCEIADEIGAKERTVKFHVSSILRKLRITRRQDLLPLLCSEDTTPAPRAAETKESAAPARSSDAPSLREQIAGTVAAVCTELNAVVETATALRNGDVSEHDLRSAYTSIERAARKAQLELRRLQESGHCH